MMMTTMMIYAGGWASEYYAFAHYNQNKRHGKLYQNTRKYWVQIVGEIQNPFLPTNSYTKYVFSPSPMKKDCIDAIKSGSANLKETSMHNLGDENYYHYCPKQKFQFH